MAYKKFIKKGGRVFGPYYYESYRDETGKVKKRYMGTIDPDKKSVTPTNYLYLFAIIFGIIGLLLVGGYIYVDRVDEISFLSVDGIVDSISKITGFSVVEGDIDIGSDGQGPGGPTESGTAESGKSDFDLGVIDNEVISDDVDDESGEELEEIVDESINEKEVVGEEIIDEEDVFVDEDINDTTIDDFDEINKTIIDEDENNESVELNETEEIIDPINNEVELDDDSNKGGVIIEINETEDLNESFVNETLINEIVINETLINETIINESIVDDSTFNESILNKSIINETLINETDVNETIFINDTILVNAKLNFSLIQYKAVINRPVKWIKTVNVSDVDGEDFNLEIPIQATNISIKTDEEIETLLDEIEDFDEVVDKIDREEIVSIALTGNAAYDIDLNSGIITKLINWFKGFTITGNVILEEDLIDDIEIVGDVKIIDLSEIANESFEIAVEYYTDAPTAEEREIKGGKEVIVNGPDNLNYTNILAYSVLDNQIGIGEGDRIKIIWKTSDSNVSVMVNFSVYDNDGDGYIDYVEWIVPHLSEQVYEIIYITKAEHLDKERVFVENIYDDVKEKDGRWSKVIFGEEFVRVTFEIPLDNNKDITIYARGSSNFITINGTEVSYEIYQKKKRIDEIRRLMENGYNKN